MQSPVISEVITLINAVYHMWPYSERYRAFHSRILCTDCCAECNCVLLSVMHLAFFFIFFLIAVNIVTDGMWTLS